MCGIAGLFGRNSGTDEVRQAVKTMTCSQIHRGPDDEGFLCRDDLTLGFRRLSIIDLSPSGSQPMSNKDKSVWVAFNGEIYNHRGLRDELLSCGHEFTSQSDTEVLVHGYEEWGIDGLLQNLRGMFAFALYDSRRQSGSAKGQLFLARDRFGIKPFYYSYMPDRNWLAFASEVRSLAKSGIVSREDNPKAWLAFLLFGSIPDPWTTFKGIRSIPPGHYLTSDGSEPQLVRYYSMDELFTMSREAGRSNGLVSLEDTEAEIRALLEETVSLHLISDAPLGVFLSGGIDSSALAALAVREKPDLKTLGVVFEEQAFSEERYQTEAAQAFNTQHTSVPVSQKDFDDSIQHFFDSMDQPTVDGLNTYFVAGAAKNAGLKTVLSGLGGDEIFCGYPTLRRAPRLWQLNNLPGILRNAVVGLGRRRPYMKKLDFLKRKGIMNFYLVQRGMFTPGEASALLDSDECEAWDVIEEFEPTDAPSDPVELQQFMEARHYLVDQLLKDSDVFGMAHSVEIRVPFLDHVLVEAILKLPMSSRLDDDWPKPLLTRPLRDLLPESLVFRTKQGFTFPIDPWIRSTNGAFRQSNNGLNQGATNEVWDEFLSGRARWARPWALTVLSNARG